MVTNTNSESEVMSAVPVGNPGLLISWATREEVYVDGGNSTRLGYGHDQLSASRSYVSLYDGESFVKTFSNSNPNFILKSPLLLVGVTPTYNIATCPNSDSTDIGEMFRLIPRTPANIKHHMSHRALSQLPIVADIDLVDSAKKIQVKSKKLGTSGVVEVVGGRANKGEFSIFGDATVIPSGGTNYLETSISAFPSTLNSGDVVKVYNQNVAKRKSRLSATDKISVEQIGNETFYKLQPKDIVSTQSTKWAMTDVSASYSKSAGTVWRWTHNDAGSRVVITAKVNGAASNPPSVHNSAGTAIPSGVTKIIASSLGSGSSPHSLTVIFDDVPTQGDYVLHYDKDGNSYAAWFSVDGNNTAPTGSSYVSATNKIKVSILSTDTPNMIAAALATALPLNVNHFAAFGTVQNVGTNLDDVIVGDQLWVSRGGPFTNSDVWKLGNLTYDNSIGGNRLNVVVGVDSINRHMDILNPYGRAQASSLLGSSGEIAIFPSMSMQWKLRHSAMYSAGGGTVSSGVASMSFSVEHKLSAGDIIDITNNDLLEDTGRTVLSTPDATSITFSTLAPNSTSTGAATISLTGQTATTYKVEKLGFNSLIRISRVNGSSPMFLDAGVCVDDIVQFSGDTWNPSNRGEFRVIGVDQDSLIIENPIAVEQLHRKSIISTTQVQFTAGSPTITGSAGAFDSVDVGMWVRSSIDGDDKLLPVVGKTSTTLTLLQAYSGTTGLNQGTVIDQMNGAFEGIPLMSEDDIKIFI